MADHASAAKRARQAKRKAVRNSRARNSVKTYEKKLRVAIAKNEKDKVHTLLRDFTSAAGKLAQKGIVHMKNTSRRVSRLSSQVATLLKT